MPVKVVWFLEDRIIYSDYSGDVTIDDISNGTQQVKVLAYEGTPLVHNIANILDINTFPKNLRQIINSIEQLDNNVLGWTIIINNNKLLRFIVATVCKIAGARFRIFDNQDDAIKFLYRMDISLQKLANK